jgi:hypothetical protein
MFDSGLHSKFVAACDSVVNRLYMMMAVERRRREVDEMPVAWSLTAHFPNH